MFERFTKEARAVVTGAVSRAERAGDPVVTEEHLLRSVLATEGTPGAYALAQLGVAGRAADVERDLDEARRHGGMSKADAEALAGLGIDVTEIVDRVEAAHGKGALAAPRGARRRRSRFGDGAKGVLEKSLRIALGRGDKHIGDEHILLALAALPGLPAEVLADHGAPYTAIADALPAAAKSA